MNVARKQAGLPGRRGGFVLVAALGALAVIMTAAFMAAGSSQMTFSMTVERQRDRRAADHVQSAASILPRMLAAPGVASSVRTVMLLQGDSADPASVTLSATLGLPADGATLAPALQPLEGDELAVVEVRRADGAGPARKSTFLVNSRGLRSSPILVREERL